MRQKLLRMLGHWAGERTWTMALVILVVTIIFTMLSSQLTMNMNLTGLLPSDDPMVEEFNYIFEEFNGASTAFIVVEGEFDDMIAYAEHIKPMILNIEDWIEEKGSQTVKDSYRALQDKVASDKVEDEGRFYERVDYKQPVDFIKNHGLMLMKSKDLKNTQELYTDPNLLPFITHLNNSLEKEYIQSDEKLSTMQKERSAVQFLDGIESWVDFSNEAFYSDETSSDLGLLAADAMTVGSPYFISPDRSMLLIMAMPTFSMMNMDYLLPGINSLEELVKAESNAFNVDVGLTGGIVLGRDEMVAGMEDSMSLTLIALVAILIMFIITFRMFAAPLLAMANLIIGIIWAMGFSYFLVDSLNMFTAMMAVILVGLGIDFSIHIISVFSELVQKGADPKAAIIETLEKVGTGIITGGFTTAAAFLTLLIARSAGVSEFGLVNGMGLIVIMISTLITLPTLLMLREKYRTLRHKSVKVTRDVSFRSVGTLAEFVYNRKIISVVMIMIVTVFFGFMMSKTTMDYNYLNMEPLGLESIALNEKLIDTFNMSSDPTMITSKSLEENRRLTEKAKTKSSISFVESITDYIPVDEEQESRAPGIDAIHEKMLNSTLQTKVTESDIPLFLDQLYRLEANIIEMQDMAFVAGQDMIDAKATRLVGNPDMPDQAGNLQIFIAKIESQTPDLLKVSRFQNEFAAEYKQQVLSMANSETITLSMLPNLISEKYISNDGSRYLMTVYPKGNVWHIDYLETHTKEVLDISTSVAGTPPMFYYLMKIIGQDGARASLLTLLVVVLFLWIDFRSLKKALFALIPLLFGVVWMVGFMGITGIQFTLLNFMAIPLIIGIGIDDGVHVLHRYSIEGKSKLFTVFSSTGKAVIITSMTTMLSFGSLVFATYRGFGSLGIALFIGVGMCMLASIFVLPAVLALFDKD